MGIGRENRRREGIFERGEGIAEENEFWRGKETDQKRTERSREYDWTGR